MTHLLRFPALMGHRTRGLSLALLIVAVVGLGACGGDDDPPAAGNTPEAGTTTAANGGSGSSGDIETAAPGKAVLEVDGKSYLFNVTECNSTETGMSLIGEAEDDPSTGLEMVATNLAGWNTLIYVREQGEVVYVSHTRGDTSQNGSSLTHTGTFSDQVGGGNEVGEGNFSVTCE